MSEVSEKIKNVVYAVSTIRDVINYNKHKSLIGDVLKRIEKELALIEEIEEADYTEENGKKFHMDLLNMGVSLLPTTEKIIHQLEMKDEKKSYEKNIFKNIKNIERIAHNGLTENDDISLLSDCMEYVVLLYKEKELEG